MDTFKGMLLLFSLLSIINLAHASSQENCGLSQAKLWLDTSLAAGQLARCTLLKRLRNIAFSWKLSNYQQNLTNIRWSYSHFPLFRCPSAYTGEYCQYQNPCNTGGQKCQNGGTCSVIMDPNRGPTFKCTCPIGYTASFCEIADTDNPCTNSPCRNGGTCSLQSRSNYTCTCPVGWKG